MFYLLDINTFPTIKNIYTVTRKTVWQITDQYNILIFILDGECRIDCDGSAYVLQTGDVFFVPAGHSYVRSPVRDIMCTMLYIHFSSDSAATQIERGELIKKISDTKKRLNDDILEGMFTLPNLRTLYLQNKSSMKDYDALFAKTKDMYMLSEKRQLMCGFQSSVRLCDILTDISQNTLNDIALNVTLKDETAVSSNLKTAIRYIILHYTEKISLSSLAEYCHISKQQLIRYFKASLNTTPTQYITDYKISRAKELLFNEPTLTIKEIADILGFDNAHYFSRVFTKATEESPSHYRYRVTHYSDNS